jgi:hypothetical protein
MQTREKIWRNAAMLTAAIVLAEAVFPRPAHAYIDPVSGSILLQVVAAGALAAAFTFKRITRRMSHFVRTLWARVWTK